MADSRACCSPRRRSNTLVRIARGGKLRRGAKISSRHEIAATPRCLRVACISAILTQMASLAPDQMAHAPRTVRLKTLIALRWFAVIGQAITVLVVHYWLEFELPLAACLGVIALSAWLNVA